MSLNMCIIYSIIFNISPLCHCWGSTGQCVRVRPHRRRERDEPETTWHHKHNLSYPQTSTAACYSTAERAAHSQPRDSWMTVLCNKCLWMLCYLGAPKFNGPIKWGGQEEMREIYGSCHCVTVNACDWTMMPLKHLTDTCPTALTHTHTQREWQRFNDQHLSMFPSVS